MMADLFWIIRFSLRLWRYDSPLNRNGLAWCGLALQFASLLLFAAAVAGLGQCAGGPANRLIAFIGAAALLSLGATAVCLGTHYPRTPQTPGGVRGAELLAAAGPPDAPGGLLVIICGYGSESPALCEPARLRQAWTGAPMADPLLQQYRKRLILRLHGGLGWNYEAAALIAASLDAVLIQEEDAAESRHRPNLVIAHSRGCQVAAATAVFRNPTWRRVAVHPPCGVHLYLRLFALFDPGIAEIHRLGVRRAEANGDSGAISPATFPWDRILQARGFDTVVRRHAAAPGLPLENDSAFGSHITPFTREQAPLWRELRRNPQAHSHGG